MNELLPILAWAGLFFLLAFLVTAVFPIWMLIDCATRKEVQNRYLWLLIIILGSGLGATIYFFTERKEANARSLGNTVVTSKSDDARFENVFEKPPQ